MLAKAWLSFNPCCVGTLSLTLEGHLVYEQWEEFQSLLCWNPLVNAYKFVGDSDCINVSILVVLEPSR